VRELCVPLVNELWFTDLRTLFLTDDDPSQPPPPLREIIVVKQEDDASTQALPATNKSMSLHLLAHLAASTKFVSTPYVFTRDSRDVHRASRHVPNDYSATEIWSADMAACWSEDHSNGSCTDTDSTMVASPLGCKPPALPLVILPPSLPLRALPPPPLIIAHAPPFAFPATIQLTSRTYNSGNVHCPAKRMRTAAPPAR
jgi:hypothetical protein